jgi:hypothetical protein
MTEDFTDLEQELKQLRPRSLPSAMVGRVAGELDAAPEAPPRGVLAQWRTWILPVVVAAVLAVTVTLIPFITRDRSAGAEKEQANVVTSHGSDVPKVAASVDTSEKLRPVRATNVLYDAVNEGVVRLADDSLAQRMRLNYLDTITWENPRSGAQFQRTVPREEILFIPVTAN